MIDPQDKSTIDAFPAKRRGRPRTGKALSDAERKRMQRERDRRSAEDLPYFKNDGTRRIKEAPAKILYQWIDRAIAIGDACLVRRIAIELVQRADDVEKA